MDYDQQVEILHALEVAGELALFIDPARKREQEADKVRFAARMAEIRRRNETAIAARTARVAEAEARAKRLTAALAA